MTQKPVNCPFPRCANRADTYTRQDGAILIVVLMILVVMSLIVMQFSFSMTLNRMIAVNNTEATQLKYMAIGGLEYTKNVLRVDRQQDEIDSLHDTWAKVSPPFEPPFKVEVEVQDECGKINVNALVKGDVVNIAVKEILERLFLDMDINIEFVHVLVDYIDPNSEGEFEDGAKNAPLDSLTELLDFDYISPEVFFSRTNGEEKILGLVDLLTIHGPGKININTAPRKVVMAVFNKVESELGAFDDYRERNIIKSVDELVPLGMTNVSEVGAAIGYGSDYYRVISRASSERLVKTVECILIRGTQRIKIIEQRIY